MMIVFGSVFQWIVFQSVFESGDDEKKRIKKVSSLSFGCKDVKGLAL